MAAGRQQLCAVGGWGVATTDEVVQLLLEEGAGPDLVQRRGELDGVAALNGAVEEALVGGPALRIGHGVPVFGRDVEPSMSAAIAMARDACPEGNE